MVLRFRCSVQRADPLLVLGGYGLRMPLRGPFFVVSQSGAIRSDGNVVVVVIQSVVRPILFHLAMVATLPILSCRRLVVPRADLEGRSSSMSRSWSDVS